MVDEVKPYSEDNPEHIPNPLYQTGFVDTTGVSGQANIDDVSPVFADARAQALSNAVEAIDNPDIDESRTVVLPDANGEDGGRAREDAIDDLRQAAADAGPGGEPVEPNLRAEGEAAYGPDGSPDGTTQQSGGVGPGAEQNDTPQTGGEPAGGSNDDPDDADGPSGNGSDAEDDQEDLDEELPADSDSKAKWVQFAKDEDLDVDQSLNKDPYIAEVKKAYRAKAK